MEGHMKDTQGRWVPENLVKQIDKTRDQLVREIITGAEQLQKIIADFKTHAMGDIQAFVDLSAEKFGVKRGGAKGNVTLMTYDGEYKIVRAMDDYVVFDERLQVAKELIDDCIRKWSVGSSDEIRALVNDAFKVDQKGKVNANRILGLRRLDIHDDTWKNAMDAIGESLQVVDTKAYIRIYRRQADGSYQPLSLSIAA